MLRTGVAGPRRASRSAGHPGVDRSGRAVLGDRADRVAAPRAPRDRPGPSWPKSSTQRRGQVVRLQRDRAGQVVDPDDRQLVRPRPRRRRPRASSWWRTCWYRSVTIAPRRFQRRRPTMCTSAARNAFAVRTTVPMFRSCCQFSIATWKRAAARSRSATIASMPPVPVPVDDVAPVAVREQLRVVPRVVRPLARPRADAHLIRHRATVAARRGGGDARSDPHRHREISRSTPARSMPSARLVVLGVRLLCHPGSESASLAQPGSGASPRRCPCRPSPSRLSSCWRCHRRAEAPPQLRRSRLRQASPPPRSALITQRFNAFMVLLDLGHSGRRSSSCRSWPDDRRKGLLQTCVRSTSSVA